MKNNNKGFTLIELLMVVTVLGFFAAIVMTQLNSARSKGGDAGVKSNLSGVRSQAGLYYENNNSSYGTFAQNTCPTTTAGGAGTVFGDANVVNLVNAALSAGGSGTSCSSNGTSYAIAVGMRTSNQAWCVDANGTSKLKTGVATPNLAITGSSCN